VQHDKPQISPANIPQTQLRQQLSQQLNQQKATTYLQGLPNSLILVASFPNFELQEDLGFYRAVATNVVKKTERVG